jgi:hypothetical protein
MCSNVTYGGDSQMMDIKMLEIQWLGGNITEKVAKWIPDQLVCFKAF